MEYRELELTLLSARDLKNVNLITRMDVYAVASISGDPMTRQCTPPDPSGGRNPCWDVTLRFFVPASAAAAGGGWLHVLLRSERALGDRDVGEVIVPLAELLAGADGPGQQPPRLASYQVHTVHRGEPRGVLNVSYRLGPVVAPVKRGDDKPPVVAPVKRADDKAPVIVCRLPQQPFQPQKVSYPAPPPPQPPCQTQVWQNQIFLGGQSPRSNTNNPEKADGSRAHAKTDHLGGSKPQKQDTQIGAAYASDMGPNGPDRSRHEALPQQGTQVREYASTQSNIHTGKADSRPKEVYAPSRPNNTPAKADQSGPKAALQHERVPSMPTAKAR